MFFLEAASAACRDFRIQDIASERGQLSVPRDQLPQVLTLKKVTIGRVAWVDDETCFVRNERITLSLKLLSKSVLKSQVVTRLYDDHEPQQQKASSNILRHVSYIYVSRVSGVPDLQVNGCSLLRNNGKEEWKILTLFAAKLVWRFPEKPIFGTFEDLRECLGMVSD